GHDHVGVGEDFGLTLGDTHSRKVPPRPRHALATPRRGGGSAATAAPPTVAAEPEPATATEKGSGAPAVGVVLGAGWEAVPRAPPHDSAAPAAPTPTDRNPELHEASTGPPRALSDFVPRRVSRRTRRGKSPGSPGSVSRGARAAEPPEVTGRVAERTGRMPP